MEDSAEGMIRGPTELAIPCGGRPSHNRPWALTGGQDIRPTVPLPHGGLGIPPTGAGINVISLIIRVVPFETELQIRRQSEVAAALSTGAT